MARYKTKPCEVEALEWNGHNLEEIKEFVGDSLIYDIIDTAWQVGKGIPHINVKIKTLEEEMIASKGDFIIKGLRGGSTLASLTCSIRNMSWCSKWQRR